MKKTFKLLIFIVIISTVMLSAMMTNVNAESTEVTAVAETTEFQLDDETKTIKLNSTGFLFYKNKPVGEKIVWTSSDSNIVTVDENGNVTGKSIGKATITATVGEQEDTCEVSVVYSMLTIQSNENNFATSINLVLGEHPTENLKAKVDDGKSEKVPNAEVKWKSYSCKCGNYNNNCRICWSI